MYVKRRWSARFVEIGSVFYQQVVKRRPCVSRVAAYHRSVMATKSGDSQRVGVDQVETWHDYFSRNKERLLVLLGRNGSKFHVSKYEVSEVLSKKVSIWQGNITHLEIDAIVNAANERLLGGGGVDGAIHKAAGPNLLKECETLNGCKTGNAKITKGYRLPAKHVIHTVGPRGEKRDLLESCYNTSLNVLIDNNLRTIAFPCVSTGVYGYPRAAAAQVALGAARKMLEDKTDSIDRIVFCLFLPEDVEIYETLLQKVFPVE